MPQEAQPAGSPAGCTQHAPTSNGSWMESEKGEVTASEQVVGKLLENSVKYKKCHFTELKLAYIFFWKTILSHPLHPPQRQLGLASVTAQRGVGGGPQDSGPQRGGAEGMGGSHSRLRNHLHRVVPVCTGPGSCQEPPWCCAGTVGGKAGEGSGCVWVCVWAWGCHTEEEARKKAASNVIY